MALYIMIRKVIDSPAVAAYTFGSDEGCLGQLKLDRTTGGVVLVEPAPGDEAGALFHRAMYKIQQHWAAREIPEVTCWAS